MPRCGHSFSYFEDNIFLFGGLIEVTKESCETFRFNIATNTWIEVGSSKPNKDHTSTPSKLLESYMHRKPSTYDTI